MVGLIPEWYIHRLGCNCRAEYCPRWSPSYPWLCFRNGTNTVSKATCEEAIQHMLQDPCGHKLHPRHPRYLPPPKHPDSHQMEMP